jgi:hypothetical protein
MRMANNVSNFFPRIGSGVSPIERFSQVDVKPQVTHSHTFGAPVYVLDARLQAGKSIPKLSKNARIGMYLGPSPRHSRKVALVLSLRTGRVSLQFHVVIDDLFETLRPSTGNSVPRSRWQEATGFTESKGAAVIERKDSQQPRAEAYIVGVIPLSELGALLGEPQEGNRTAAASDHRDSERSTEADEFHDAVQDSDDSIDPVDPPAETVVDNTPI